MQSSPSIRRMLPEVVLKEKGGRNPESRNGFAAYAGIVGATLTALLVILLLILRRKREE